MAAVAARVTAAIRVGVAGRPGVGVTTVAAALAGAGIPVCGPEQADVYIRVIAEVLKPEDLTALPASIPALVVLTKADLAGDGTALADADRRAARFAAVAGVPVEPMIGLLARAALEPDDVEALRVLVGAPADMTSTDAFVTGPHALTPQTRRRLLDRVDRFGLAHAVLAVASGAGPEAVARRLRDLSRLDRVLARLTAVAAPVRYRRVRAALHELHTLAAQRQDDALFRWLTGDDVVLSVMAAAVDVVAAAGLTVDPADDPEAHLRRAVAWQRYGRGPVTPMHRRCAADITRGSLRLLERTR